MPKFRIGVKNFYDIICGNFYVAGYFIPLLRQIIILYFTGMIELKELITTQAKDNFRTVAMEILYRLKGSFDGR